MKPKAERKADETNKTRDAILDATEQLMREEGYAAVSSRRIADRAGLKSQLVHYYFGTMDDLFIALFHRAERQHFERYLQIMSCASPIRELWNLSTDRPGMGLIFEFMALANHREAVRKEIARSTVQTRSMQTAMLTRALEEGGVASAVWSANVLSVLLSGAAQRLMTEESIGVTAAHDETFAFVEKLIGQVEQGRKSLKKSSRRKG
jgi:AcrR family transcriptional regulator